LDQHFALSSHKLREANQKATKQGLDCFIADVPHNDGEVFVMAGLVPAIPVLLALTPLTRGWPE
jgi:hypothetical protein